jgi:hypothetical protein
VQLKAYPLYNQLHFLALPATIVTAYLDHALTGQIKDAVLTWGEWKNPKQSKNAYNATPHPHTGVPRVQHTMLSDAAKFTGDGEEAQEIMHVHRLPVVPEVSNGRPFYACMYRSLLYLAGAAMESMVNGLQDCGH